MLRTSLAIVIVGALCAAACTLRNDPPPQPYPAQPYPAQPYPAQPYPAQPYPAQPASFGAGCGVQLFQTQACEAALDQGCCQQQTDCAADPACARIAQCLDSCKGRGDNCANGCASQGGAASTKKWLLIADCSKYLRYPPGAVCNDSH